MGTNPTERGEQLYDTKRVNNGEYLQMALINVACRTVVPGNTHGTRLVIGREIEELCDNGKRSTLVTNVLNRPTTRKRICGLYLSKMYLYQKRNITIQAVYEIMEVPRTLMHNKAVFKTMRDIVRKEEEDMKKDKGTEDNDEDGTKKPPSELNLFRM